MPTYEFECLACQRRVEIKLSFAEAESRQDCDKCLVPMKKVFHAAPAHFRGTGWGKDGL